MTWFLAGAAVGAIFGFYIGLNSWPPLAPVRVEDRGWPR
jgi:hypothetical protein